MAKFGLCTDLTLTNPLAKAALDQQLAKITKITDTIREALRKQIKVGFDKGESVDEIADRLKKQFQATRARCRTIARTEINQANNTGHQLQAQQNFGTNYDKVWVTARDMRVRKTHQALNGIRLKATQPFNNGLQHPHDPQGSAAEVINCRCTLMYFPHKPESLIEKKLKSSEISSSKELSTGVSETKLLTFSDGSKGIFKSSAGEPDGMRSNIKKGYQTPREVAAWEVAKIVGLDDMVAPIVARNVRGEDGVISSWQNGEVGAKSKNRWDGDDLPRAGLFDYVIGNEDRHSSNWIVPEGGRNLKLIDHGLAFPDAAYRFVSSRLLEKVVTRYKESVAIAGKISEHAAPYLRERAAILAKLKAVGLSNDAVAGVGRRIDFLSKPKLCWEDLEKPNAML